MSPEENVKSTSVPALTHFVRFIVRDFKWDPEALEKQNKELSELKAEEKELWVSTPGLEENSTWSDLTCRTRPIC